MKETFTGIELIAKEHQEQIEKHGIRVIDDVSNNSDGQLRVAATKLIGYVDGFGWPDNMKPDVCDQMEAKSKKDKLICAGAMIAREIDRLQALENG